jgi:hypothetical protein
MEFRENSWVYNEAEKQWYKFLCFKEYHSPENFKRIENDFTKMFLKIHFYNKNEKEQFRYGVKAVCVTSSYEVTEENYKSGKEKIENDTYTTPAALKINNH